MLSIVAHMLKLQFCNVFRVTCICPDNYSGVSAKELHFKEEYDSYCNSLNQNQKHDSFYSAQIVAI